MKAENRNLSPILQFNFGNISKSQMPMSSKDNYDLDNSAQLYCEFKDILDSILINVNEYYCDGFVSGEFPITLYASLHLDILTENNEIGFFGYMSFQNSKSKDLKTIPIEKIIRDAGFRLSFVREEYNGMFFPIGYNVETTSKVISKKIKDIIAESRLTNTTLVTYITYNGNIEDFKEQHNE